MWLVCQCGIRSDPKPDGCPALRQRAVCTKQHLLSGELTLRFFPASMLVLMSLCVALCGLVCRSYKEMVTVEMDGLIEGSGDVTLPRTRS